MGKIKNLLYHFFVPHHGNNHRAKLLHNSSIFFIIVVLIGVNLITTFVKKNTSGVLGISYSISEGELLSMINKVRQEKGLDSLAINDKLASAARLKAQDMFNKNYWAHFAPDGASPWGFIRESGYNYVYAGENLAKGFNASQEVIDAWMNSETHRDNILSNKYNDMGFAIVEGNLLGEDTVLIVQLFGSSEASSSKQIAEASVSTASIKNNNLNDVVPSVVLEPTALPTIIQEKTELTSIVEKKIVPSAIVKSDKTVAYSNPVFEIGILSRSVLIIIFSSLVLAFIIDLIIVERKKVPRLVGHNIDHIMLITLFIILVLFQRTGFVI